MQIYAVLPDVVYVRLAVTYSAVWSSTPHTLNIKKNQYNNYNPSTCNVMSVFLLLLLKNYVCVCVCVCARVSAATVNKGLRLYTTGCVFLPENARKRFWRPPAGHGPDPLGELTALPRTCSWIKSRN